MRILAIDYGEQKIGWATSDEAGRVAFPGGVIKNDKNLLENILKIINEKGVGKIVIGKSLNQAGAPNPMQTESASFAHEISAKSGLEIDWCDERFTTNEATREIKSKRDVDARAATVILTRYLESLHL